MALIENRGQGDIFCLSTFFYDYLCKNGYYGVRNWSKRVDMFRTKYIFVPLNFNRHWTLMVCIILFKSF